MFLVCWGMGCVLPWQQALEEQRHYHQPSNSRRQLQVSAVHTVGSCALEELGRNSSIHEPQWQKQPTWRAAASLMIVGGSCRWSPASTPRGARSSAPHVATSSAWPHRHSQPIQHDRPRSTTSHCASHCQLLEAMHGPTLLAMVLLTRNREPFNSQSHMFNLMMLSSLFQRSDAASRPTCAASSTYTTSNTPFLPSRFRPSTPVSVAHTTWGGKLVGLGHYPCHILVMIGKHLGAASEACMRRTTW